MTLLMRDQENIKKGIRQGVAIMIENALKTTKSIQKTSEILNLEEAQVRDVAQEKRISVDD